MTTKQHRKDGGVEPPIDLGGLFPDSDDEKVDGEDDEFVSRGETQLLTIGKLQLQIRQFSWHQANANQVWPGTFILADFLDDMKDRYNASCIELGAATGALAIYLRLQGYEEIITCDIDDGGEVAENIIYNTNLNGLDPGIHIPHTWGTGWAATVAKQPQSVQDHVRDHPVKFIIASDILLYVSAYPALVQTLVELFAEGTVVEFLMAWNRRISASGEFFELMKQAGFQCHHHGQCIYSFFTAESAAGDEYLLSLDSP